MSSRKQILAVVVTYNRCILLSRCIDFLQNQTRSPDAILVINNGSTDSTEAMLVDRAIRYITQDNVGSAGGWYRGIQCAIDEGFDAVWLMDDDGYPDINALNVLEPALTSDVACISSVVLQEDQPNLFVFPFSRLDQKGLPIIFGFPRKIGDLSRLRKDSVSGQYPYAHLFNGALVSVTAARTIGNVNQNFFIFGDEVDYFFRLRSVGKVISLCDAAHYHPDVSQRPYTPMKVYYYVKNSLILNSKYFNYVWLRNVLAVIAVLVRTSNRNGFFVMLSYVMGRNSPIFWRAIVRGLRGVIARDFDG